MTYVFNKYQRKAVEPTMIPYITALKLYREATGLSLSDAHQHFKDNFSMHPIRLDILGAFIRAYYEHIRTGSVSLY